MRDPKIALALIVKGSDIEAEALKVCLKYNSPYVDGIFITITQPNKKVEEVAKLFKATVSHFKWIDDFSAARNFNFAQVPKEYDYILWCDADDVFEGLHSIKKVIKANPKTDVFVMNYLYWVDMEKKRASVVHLKTQIVKNDGCVKWAGYLHEDFSPTRKIEGKFVKGIQRIHISTPQRFEDNKRRNLEISEKYISKYPDDPRNWWNLANSQKAMDMKKEAIKNFKKFIKMSDSDDEKYIARLRLAEMQFLSGDFSGALDHTRYAIGTKPEYPDAYNTMGMIYFQMNDFEKAKDNYKLALTKKPPIYNIIVYNPRDYDYNPLMNLAKTYFNLHLPSQALDCLKACKEIEPTNKELDGLIKTFEVESAKFEKVIKRLGKLNKIKNKDRLKKAIDGLSDDVRSHPAICQLRNTNFIKEESSGKDLVFFCGFTENKWDGEIMREKGSGGSEEALCLLAEQLVKKGWNVTIFCNCGHKVKKVFGVAYKPFWMWNYRDKQDITVIWRHVKPIDYGINSTKVCIDLHDTVPKGEFNEKRLPYIDKIFVKSKAHRDLYPNVPDNKFCIIPNGIDLTLFDKYEGKIERDPYYLINLSSPDRMIKPMMEIYEEALKRVSPEIRKKVKLGWFYGWDLFNLVRTSDHEQEWRIMQENRFEELREKGMCGGGRISLEEVVKENYRAGALLYPTAFYEIDFMGGSKAQIAGVVPITTDFGALDEKIQHGIKLKADVTIDDWALHGSCDFGIKTKELKEKFIEMVVLYLNNPDDFNRREMSEWAREEFDIKKVADLWDRELKIPKLENPIKKYTQI